MIVIYKRTLTSDIDEAPSKLRLYGLIDCALTGVTEDKLFFRYAKDGLSTGCNHVQSLVKLNDSATCQ